MPLEFYMPILASQAGRQAGRQDVRVGVILHGELLRAEDYGQIRGGCPWMIAVD